jgi:type II secretory pathway component PulF
MKLFEATIRTQDGKEFKDCVGANDAYEARMLLQQRHGPRAVPFLPHMIPS